MSRGRKKQQSEWLVPVRIELEGATACVLANSAEEAREKAESGHWEWQDNAMAEMVNWKVVGQPEENK